RDAADRRRQGGGCPERSRAKPERRPRARPGRGLQARRRRHARVASVDYLVAPPAARGARDLPRSARPGTPREREQDAHLDAPDGATGSPAGLRRPCDGSQRFRHPPNRCQVETLRRYPERDAWARAVCQQDSEARRTERTPRRGASEGRGGVMSLSSARIDPVVLPSDADRSGRDLGTEELAQPRRGIESGTLNCTTGTQVRAFKQAFAARYGVPHARAVTSGRRQSTRPPPP